MLDGRLLRSIRHTPVRQLAWRAWLLLKRNLLVRFGSRPARPGRYSLLRVVDSAPLPILPPRGGCSAEGNGVFVFEFLHRAIPFTLPINWHRPELCGGTRLWNLHLHYFEYLEACGDNALETLVRDWIAANRPYSPGYWLDAWNSYALSIRSVVWMQQYARRLRTLPPEFLDTWKNSIAEQLDFLATNLERDIGGNHVIKNIKALLWGGQFFQGRFGDRLARLGGKLLDAELRRQILSDGFHFELSPAYHCQVFADLLECWGLRPPSGRPSRLQTTLERMAGVIVDMTHPDGRVALFNDGGLEMGYSPATLLRTWTRLGGRAKTADAWHAFAYGDAGYFGLRAGGWYCVVDAGRAGPDGLPAHAHGDIFSFECSMGGARVIVDQGVFEYDAGERRQQARSTSAHNTLTLDDHDQCEFWSSFRMGRRARVTVESATIDTSGLEVRALHDGFRRLAGRPLHRRCFRVRDGDIRICDEVTGRGSQHVVARILLAPAVATDVVDAHRVRCTIGRHAFLVTSDAAIRVEAARWWPDFGVEESTTRLVFDCGVGAGIWHHRIALQEDAVDGRPRVLAAMRP